VSEGAPDGRPPLSNIRVIAFDFDGTVVDSMGGFGQIAGELLSQARGITEAEGRRLYRETSGLPFFQQLESLYPGAPDNPQIAETFESRKLAGFFSQPYFDDMAPALTILRAAGRRLAICSNNSQDNIESFVTRHDFTWDHVLGFKPDFEKGPSHFDHVRNQESISKAEMLLVGDSLKDAEKAQDYGIAFIGRTGTFTRTDFKQAFPGVPVIDTLAELPRLLGVT
jgi:phosphoglycolate phosphatase-like HAD superfamily hydrolase